MRRMRVRSARFYAVLAFILALISGGLTCSYLQTLKVPNTRESKNNAKSTPVDQVRQELADLVPEGMRGFVIPLGEQKSSVAELKTGNYVDVVAIFDNSNGNSSARTAVRRSKILSADSAGNIVLLVTPEEAERLAFALAYGKIAVTLCPNKEER